MPNVDNLTALLVEAQDCLDRMRHWHAGIGPRTESDTAIARRLAELLEVRDELGRQAYPHTSRSSRRDGS